MSRAILTAQSQPGTATLLDVLTSRATDTPERLAYSFLPAAGAELDQLTYSGLQAAAAGIAARIAETGEPGDRVLILSATDPNFLAAFFGTMLAGRIPVPVATPRGRAAVDGLAMVAADCQPAAIAGPRAALGDLTGLADGAGRALARLRRIVLDEPPPSAAAEAGPLPAPDDIAFLQYTSGSTAQPRGVVLRHRSLLHNLEVIRDAFGHSAESQGVSWLPPHHDMGLIGGILQPLYAGFPVVLMSPATFLRSPLSWLRAISDHRATSSGGPTFCYDYCVRRISPDDAADLDLSCWEVAFVGAEPISPRVLENFCRHFAPSGFRPSSLLPCYGLAESTLFVSGAPRGTGVRAAQPAGGGQSVVNCGPVRGGEAAIVDPDSRQRVAPGGVGEVWLTGPSVADGYWHNDDETAAVFRARLAGDPPGGAAYLRTGDLGFEADGELHLAGRLKELIIIRGRNVFPQDVERSIEAGHPGLRRGGCAVVSTDRGGEERLVVIQEVERSTLAGGRPELAASIRAAVSRDHALDVDRVVFVRPGQIPKTTSGKIQRLAARATLLGPEPGDPDPDSLRAQVVEWAARRFGLDRAALDAAQPLTALGLDSVKAAELNTYLERQFGYTVPAERIFDGLTVAGLVAEIAAHRAETPAPAPSAQPAAPVRPATPGARPVAFSLFFFASDAEVDTADKYRLFLDCVGFADRAGFHAIWTPERHFHRFGGLFPNPAVLGAAVATTTSRVRIRAGSVVLPLHNPVRVAEDWSVIDNLSGGRVDVAFATGWNADDFVLAADHYPQRAQVLLEGVDRVRRLWRGESVALANGKGEPTEVRIFPAPVQPELPTWITCSGGIERFEQAGRLGANVLTALLFQDVDELRGKLAAYRAARAEHGHDPRAGRVTLMLHTFLGTDEGSVRAVVQAPFTRYLRDSVDLWRRGSAALDSLSETEQATVLDFAFERYYRTSALFGTPDQAAELVARLSAAGVDEIACLIDFGVAGEHVLGSLRHLTELKNRRAGNQPAGQPPAVARAAAAGPATGRPAGDQPAGDHPAGGQTARPAQSTVDLGSAVRGRYALARRNDGGVLAKARDFDLAARLEAADLLPFYPDLSGNDGATCWYQGRQLIMLGSNNYLGLTADRRVREAAAAAALADGPSVTGSRLMNGSTPAHGALERALARFVGRPDALLLTTGYQANIGLLSAFMTDGTVLVVDEECHASIYDGAAVGGCRLLQFRHNDVADLDRRLADDVGSTPAMVMVDGVYSMSGDLAPLPEIKAVCDQHGVPLALDDAHGLGMMGAGGRGAEEELGVIGCADVLTGTFSKSLASVGGWLAGPRQLMDWVRYYGRSMLFSAAIPPPAVAAAAAALEILAAEPGLVGKIRELAGYWRNGLAERGFDTGTSQTAIVPVIVGDEITCLRFAKRLLDGGVYANCIMAPAVPANRAMLRTTVTAAHDKQHLDRGLEVFASVGRELGVLR
jgi:natural product biosynthesis luciferase-like monooxygenase protein